MSEYDIKKPELMFVIVLKILGVSYIMVSVIIRFYNDYSQGSIMLNYISQFWFLVLFVLFVFLFSIFKPIIKGYIGEKTISIILLGLDKNKYLIINDLMVYNQDKTSQIDHVIVSNFGIFVIETKNYKGWILGDEYSKYWKQVIYKRKEKMYNPIRQNRGHVEAIKKLLSNHKYSNITIIPIIVFSVNADLKVNTNTEVIHSVNLNKTIRKYNKEVITDIEKKKIYSLLSSSNIKDKIIRKNHVASIKNKTLRKQNINTSICPRCKGKLIRRKGKYGYFMGCSNFPRCRYTLQIDKT